MGGRGERAKGSISREQRGRLMKVRARRLHERVGFAIRNAGVENLEQRIDMLYMLDTVNAAKQGGRGWADGNCGLLLGKMCVLGVYADELHRSVRGSVA